jgi:hypothetical protein
VLQRLREYRVYATKKNSGEALKKYEYVEIGSLSNTGLSHVY